jgi:hypothetical protein
MAVTSAQLLKNEIKSERPETVDWILYDSVLTVAAATQTLRLFTNSVGNVGINRTNMKNQGQLSGQQSFFITALKMVLRNTAGTPFFFAGGAGPTIHPANVVFGAMTFNLILDPVTKYEGHGGQLWEQKDYMNDTAAALGQQTYPESGFKAIKFNNPIVISPNKPFWIDVTLTTPAAAQGYTAAGTPLYCYLYGFLRRQK